MPAKPAKPAQPASRPAIDFSNPDAVRAEADRRGRLRAAGHTTFTGAAVELQEIDEGALEKVQEREGDRIVLALGFEIVMFSHPGPTKQTPGIPDRKYYHRRRRLTFWWEAKSDTGKQRPDQSEFQAMAGACGEAYVLGTADAMVDYLVRICVVRRVNGYLEPVPYRDE